MNAAAKGCRGSVVPLSRQAGRRAKQRTQDARATRFLATSALFVAAVVCLLGRLPFASADPSVRTSSGTAAQSGFVHTALPVSRLATDNQPLANASVLAPPAPNKSKLDSELIHHPLLDATPGSNSKAPTQAMDFSRMVAALAAVIALIFALKWAGKKFFVPAGLGVSSRAVQVLGRTPLAPRQQILLLRVGRRVIVVGDSGGQMSALSQITDPDEVASLVGELRSGRSESVPENGFGSLLGRARNALMPADQDDAEEVYEESESMPDPATAETATSSALGDEINGLMARIRSVSRNFREG